MIKARLRHMIVVLPGITGSVLRKNGKDLWAFSGSAIWNSLANRQQMLKDLTLPAVDDYTLDDLGDGVSAEGLMQNASIVPGLVKMVTGYTDLVKAIRDRFDVVGHGLQSDEPSNLYEFAYDWRRDNRASARQLKRLIEDRLHSWREYTSDKNAKVILLAHSMGGLVSRHYLEVLEGWRDCLALVSFGTPYRGSLNALRFLVQGYKQATLDLTDCLRSYTSVYQLLPTYPVVKDGESYCRATEIEAEPLDKTRAQAALAFHQAIADLVDKHNTDATYVREGYRVVPFVGTRQPTLQSATLANGKLTLSAKLPPDVYPLLEAGDGTVPRFSATPMELDNEFRETFVPQKHGALQASSIILSDLISRLEQMQVPRTKAIRGPEISTEGAAIALSVEDLYLGSEPAEFRASVLNMAGNSWKVIGSVSRADGGDGSLPLEFKPDAAEWVARAPALPPGLYRLIVRTTLDYPLGPPPVDDLFEVVP